MAPLPRMDNPICLIMNSADNELSVNEEAKTILSKISQPLVVVSIVGPYRSGKSYLINKLSGQPGGVFSVDPTIKANTKGIWMWCMPHPNKHEHTLVLLDTEGMGDPQKGDKDNDCIILSLAMLMSSAVIYNSSVVINHCALEKLDSTLSLHSEIADKASTAKVRSQSQGDTFNTVPLFVWVIRDFTLKSDLDGRTVTADEYLENCLKDVPVKTLRGKKQNEMRRTIRAHFPKRKCFYFGFPSADKEILGRISQVPESELAPEFVRNAGDFCQFILQEASAKELREGRIMTGSDFAQVLKSYVDVVTKCEIAHLERSMSNIFLEENQSSIHSSIESYENKMKAQQFNNKEEFQRLHERSLEEALHEFEKTYVKHEKSQAEYLHQLEKDLLEKREELWKVCEDSSLKKCEDLFEKLRDEVDAALKKEKYHAPGGYDAFVKDKENALGMYNEECDKGIKDQEVRKKLSDYLEDLGNTIPKTLQAPSVKKLKKLIKGDSQDWNQLSEYVQDYQLPAGQFDRILIQLFGFTGHGKSSFVNSCLYVLGKQPFQDQAGEGVSQGGMTMERKAYKLTNILTIVDNRGFATLEGPEAWEVYAQLCNFAPLNEKVDWNKSLEERLEYVLQEMKKSPDLIFPVFVCSSQYKLNDDESDTVRRFLRKAQELTGIQPFVVLTKSKKTSRLQTTFSHMGIEKICPIENYIISENFPERQKHLNLLNVFKDILQSVDFHLQESNFQTQQSTWRSFLIKMASDIQKDSA